MFFTGSLTTESEVNSAVEFLPTFPSSLLTHTDSLTHSLKMVQKVIASGTGANKI